MRLGAKKYQVFLKYKMLCYKRKEPIMLNETKKDLEIITESEDKSKENILFKDYPKLHITEKTRQNVLDHPELHSGLSVRTRMGKFYTNEEWEQRRENVLSTPLPGGDKKSLSLVKKRISPKSTNNK